MLLLFVYGSLKRGCYNNYLLREGGAKFLGEMELKGYELYTTHGYYPYMVESNNSKVKGELWEVPEETLQVVNYPPAYARGGGRVVHNSSIMA